jgi:segregation and condensation protein B
MDIIPALEAILFVAESPVPAAELSQVLEVPPDEVTEALADLGRRLSQTGSGLVLREAGGGWRLYTRPDLHPFLERYAATPSASKLSRAALEALAVVAYRQPVSRGQVSEIRGVDSEQALRTLERRSLIDVVGHAPGPGDRGRQCSTAPATPSWRSWACDRSKSYHPLPITYHRPR